MNEDGAHDARVLAFLRQCFWAAVAAAHPSRVVPPGLPPPPRGRTIVVGAGKASAAMAAAVEDAWPADLPLTGLVITRHRHGVPTRRIEVVEGGHPLPDESGASAAELITCLAASAGKDDLLLALVSGGGSSLLGLPAQGLDFSELRVVTAALLRSGARIEDINVVRKHFSRNLGGQLVLRTGTSPVHVLLISDVTGDDPSDIASGPFAPDPSTWDDVHRILLRHGIEVSERARVLLERGLRGAIPDTPKPGDSRFAAVHHSVVASGRTALDAARDVLTREGVRVIDLSDKVTGEAREVAATHSRQLLELRPDLRPLALVSGGETTVTVRGAGKGGRNSEYALGLLLSLRGERGIFGLAADTDGWDGSGPHAGALIAPNSLRHIGEENARAALADNDSRTVFEQAGGLLFTGATGTNVNDLRIVLAL